MERIAVCTTRRGDPHPRYWESLIGLQWEGGYEYKPVDGKQGVDEGHNRLIEWFMGTDCQWMLHLDADAVVHPATLQKLMAWGEPFVSALAFLRQPPYLPVLYTRDGDKEWAKNIDLTRDWLYDHFGEIAEHNQPLVLAEGKLVEVTRGGAHCLLCHREVFEKMGPPWFMRSGSAAERGAGSDFYFYEKAQRAGFTCYLDLGVISGHLQGEWCVGPLDFLAWDTISKMSEDGTRINFKFRRFKNATD